MKTFCHCLPYLPVSQGFLATRTSFLTSLCQLGFRVFLATKINCRTSLCPRVFRVFPAMRINYLTFLCPLAFQEFLATKTSCLTSLYPPVYQAFPATRINCLTSLFLLVFQAFLATTLNCHICPCPPVCLASLLGPRARDEVRLSLELIKPEAGGERQSSSGSFLHMGRTQGLLETKQISRAVQWIQGIPMGRNAGNPSRLGWDGWPRGAFGGVKLRQEDNHFMYSSYYYPQIL